MVLTLINKFSSTAVRKQPNYSSSEDKNQAIKPNECKGEKSAISITIMGRYFLYGVCNFNGDEKENIKLLPGMTYLVIIQETIIPF